jgi:hypothetical protein
MSLCQKKVGKQHSINTSHQIVYEKLTKAFRELEVDHGAVLRIKEKCIKIAKLFS